MLVRIVHMKFKAEEIDAFLEVMAAVRASDDAAEP